MPSQLARDADFSAFEGRDGKRTAHKTVLDARQRLTSSSGTRSDYDFQLMHDYADSRLGATLPMAAIVGILATLSSFWVPLVFSALWAGMVIAGLLVVVLTARRFKHSDPNKFSATKWKTSFVAAETAFGIALSLLALFTLVGNPADLAPVMFAMVLVSVAANAVAAHTLPPATLASTLPVTVTVAGTLIAFGGTLNYTLAAVAICGEVFFLFLARQLHASELETISHQAEKDTLIGELEEAREMSDEARRHAEQANIAKSQFLATMSHELRTPLNAIIGFSEVLKSELLGPHQVPQYKEYAGDIHSSGQHLLNLINELLDLSRIEAGKYELNEEVVSLADIAEDCRRMMELRAKSKGIELVFSIGDNLPKLWGDERAIRQVLLNLLSNAIKFTPQNGRVTLVVQRSADGGQLISVKDNGPGIPENEIETVLSSFGQGSLAQKTAEQGAGLGLPIVQKIMDLHQGRFDLFSKLRFGTEVIATFPRARVMDAVAPVVQRRNRLEIYSEAG
ncbi:MULTISPECIES: HAMP domain-containing sensor histidine kinase [Devosia]|uniref:histidine kinase n=1 Tax=Devosia equisanguinis TaxID=2490941 RepID=A0A447ICL6_9HYPH|nr:MULTISPECIES: HAMP domain-containing sensor histidine kinase [Devosia]ODT47349.1 MAG: two-component sensor histidine kinase [Pelagibacterium sp. SCN 63-126]ODU87027.1 MAG: two-component sensor histidine kinase [Pelagibacterium sp. SCN 63-17]OJX42943.1 MAG: two-component sensor histidine kinase [Devosia sp. 63-57]VDS05221.1 Non-motile and phage-resistance protein [Devosia equisanguinis]